MLSLAMTTPSGVPCIWLTFPPLLTNNFHPEVGLPELTSNLRASGLTVQSKDLNVELISDELTRADSLARLGRWICRISRPDPADPADIDAWRRALLEAARVARLGPADPGPSLSDFLARERRRTNRSHRPDTEWIRVRPPTLDQGALESWPRELREQAAGFVELCLTREGLFWKEVVEALQYLLFAPRTFHLSDVLAAADREPPLLRRFFVSRLEAMAAAGPPPDLFGVSIHAQDQLVPALILLDEVRRRWPEALRVAGGPWCTAAWELLPRALPLFDHLDAVVAGKGLEPLLELSERARRGAPLGGIAGVAVPAGSLVTATPPRPGRPLDQLRLPSFDDLPLELYPQQRLPVRLHDGCAWGRCRFCYHLFPGVHAVGASPISSEALEGVVDHVAELRRRHGVRWFTLLDHAVPFITLQRFAELVRRAGLDIEWDAMVRAEPGLTAQGCQDLREGGGREVFLGVETIDPEGLRRLNKGITPELIEEAARAYAGAGLRVRVFLLNVPGQDLGELERSLEWALSRFPQVQDAMVGRFTLARGTRSWEGRAHLGIRVADDTPDDPDLDVFQLRYRVDHELSFDRYRRFWLFAKERFRDARTALDLAEMEGSSPPRRETRITLLGTGIGAAHARGEAKRYNLATASLQAYLQGHPTLGERVEVHRISLSFGLDDPTFGDEVVDLVLESEPDVLGLSCYAWDLEAQLSLASRAKTRRPRLKVVLGGPSATFGTRALMEANPAVDAVVRGEGEETFAALLGAGLDSPAGIPGVAWRDPSGSLHEEPLGPPVADLASLPSPLLDGVLEPPRENLLLEFSRGCIYRCRHCAWQTHGKGIRCVPAARVRDEIAWARDHGYGHGFVIDSAINNDDAWLGALTRAIAQGDPRGELVLSYFINYRLITPDQARRLSKVRTHEVLLGLESVNPRALSAAGRRSTIVDDFTRAVDLLSEAVGAVTPNIMFGMPGDDLEGFRRTLDFVATLAERTGTGRSPKIRGARIHWAIVPPGSYFSENAANFGLEIHGRGVPYVLGSDTFPRGDLVRGLELIREHPRADLFIWEDAEPVRILGCEVPDMVSPGGGRVGGPAPERIDDEAVLGAIAPLTPGRRIRGWRVEPLGRRHGFPEVTLSGPQDRLIQLGLRPRETDPHPLARTRRFDLICDHESASAEESNLLTALIRLISKNDQM